ncbi:MAG: TIGR02186 family protein [Paracoccaceae bacterium]
MIRLLVLFVALALPASAEEVVAGLSQNRIAINANFDGSEILIFGAVKRDRPPPDADPLQVIIAISGPSQPITVRRKARRFGIWVNVDSVEVDLAPSFYSIATTAPFSEVISDIEDLRYHVSIPRAIRSVGAPDNISDSAKFTEALIRIRTKSGLYQLNPGTVTLDEETLFQTSVALPANLTEGQYTARMFLTRGRKVIDVYETSIDVRKVGIERWLFALAHERPLIYGLLSLFIAIVAGWGASAIFRYMRP